MTTSHSTVTRRVAAALAGAFLTATLASACAAGTDVEDAGKKTGGTTVVPGRKLK